MNGLRIVLAGAFPYPSFQGSQVYTRGAALALRDRGHEVTLVTYGFGSGTVDPGMAHIGVPVPHSYRRLRSGPDLTKPFLDLRLAHALSRVRADVLFAQNLEALGAAVLAQTRTGVPVVYGCHTLFGEELPTYFDSFPRAWGRVGALVDRTLPFRSQAIVTLSVRAAEHFRSAGHPRVRCVPPGFHPSEFPPVLHARAPGLRTMVYAGNPDRYQDLDVLIAAARLLPEVRLLLVSEADWSGQDIGPATLVRTGTWSETREVLARADVAVVPRAVCAGFPLKLLNYLADRKSVV